MRHPQVEEMQSLNAQLLGALAASVSMPDAGQQVLNLCLFSNMRVFNPLRITPALWHP